MLPEFVANAPRRFMTPAAASILVGFLQMLVARFVLKSPFFSTQRESDPGPGKGRSRMS